MEPFLSCLLNFSMVVEVILDSKVFDSQSKDFYEFQAKIEIYGIGYTCIFIKNKGVGAIWLTWESWNARRKTAINSWKVNADIVS